DVDGGEYYHRGHMVAVAVELLEGLELARLQIARDAFNHLAEIFVRDAETPHRMVEGGPDRMPAEAPVERVFHFVAPLADGGEVGAGLVAQIVAVAHEGIDGAHGFALLAREQQERI